MHSRPPVETVATDFGSMPASTEECAVKINFGVAPTSALVEEGKDEDSISEKRHSKNQIIKKQFLSNSADIQLSRSKIMKAVLQHHTDEYYKQVDEAASSPEAKEEIQSGNVTLNEVICDGPVLSDAIEAEVETQSDEDVEEEEPVSAMIEEPLAVVGAAKTEAELLKEAYARVAAMTEFKPFASSSNAFGTRRRVDRYVNFKPSEEQTVDEYDSEEKHDDHEGNAAGLVRSVPILPIFGSDLYAPIISDFRSGYAMRPTVCAMIGEQHFVIKPLSTFNRIYLDDEEMSAVVKAAKTLKEVPIDSLVMELTRLHGMLCPDMTNRKGYAKQHVTGLSFTLPPLTPVSERLIRRGEKGYIDSGHRSRTMHGRVNGVANERVWGTTVRRLDVKDLVQWTFHSEVEDLKSAMDVIKQRWREWTGSGYVGAQVVVDSDGSFAINRAYAVYDPRGTRSYRRKIHKTFVPHLLGMGEVVFGAPFAPINDHTFEPLAVPTSNCAADLKLIAALRDESALVRSTTVSWLRNRLIIGLVVQEYGHLNHREIRTLKDRLKEYFDKEGTRVISDSTRGNGKLVLGRSAPSVAYRHLRTLMNTFSFVERKPDDFVVDHRSSDKYAADRYASKCREQKILRSKIMKDIPLAFYHLSQFGADWTAKCIAVMSDTIGSVTMNSLDAIELSLPAMRMFISILESESFNGSLADLDSSIEGVWWMNFLCGKVTTEFLPKRGMVMLVVKVVRALKLDIPKHLYDEVVNYVRAEWGDKTYV
jgi:dihydroxyacetone kinase DhaKLM complex PTS-EIIA-like component DhaM